jgi:hypothetical protein
VPFIQGIELSGLTYDEVVAPIIARRYHNLAYAAALIGHGSEVLGFDTEMSTDHEWGPRMLLLLGEDDSPLVGEICEVLGRDLPASFLGRAMCPVAPIYARDVGPYIGVGTVGQFVRHHLDFDITQPPDVADWMTLPSQKLLELTAGAVYHDGTGELTTLRQQLAYYPHDVWLYLLAAGWQRLSQEEHLMPRAGYVGDELGSAVIGSRLVRDVMSLCFLMEKRYAPYPKWFGTAFSQLGCANAMSPLLWDAQQAATWREREASLASAYELLARMHNSLGLTEPMTETVSSFHERPFRVMNSERFADTIRATIKDPAVAKIASRRLIGSIDQFSDSTDMRSWPYWRQTLRRLYL